MRNVGAKFYKIWANDFLCISGLTALLLYMKFHTNVMNEGMTASWEELNYLIDNFSILFTLFV